MNVLASPRLVAQLSEPLQSSSTAVLTLVLVIMGEEEVVPGGGSGAKFCRSKRACVNDQAYLISLALTSENCTSARLHPAVCLNSKQQAGAD